MKKTALLFLMIISFLPWQVAVWAQPHNYLHDLYDRLHDSPKQQWYKQIAPMPIGVVYIQWPEHGEKEMREHFRTMKQLGYTCLKQIMAADGWTEEQIQLIALEEGLVPWWYDDGGWEPITDELRKKLKIDAKLPIAEVRKHPKMLEYQRGVLKTRIERAQAYRQANNGNFPRTTSTAFDPTIGGRGLELNDKGKALFYEWVRSKYPTIEALNKAYNQYHAGLSTTGGSVYTSWEDFKARWESYNNREYAIKRDIFRFKAEHGFELVRERINHLQAFDPHFPFRGGGELGLFLPQAWFGVDLEGIADQLKDAGSFYPSIHYSWHYDQVENELARPFYMQSSFANDLYKGGWSGAWECTGGPQQFDGEKYGLPKGFTVDEYTLTQFFLSQIASGFKGFGIWCWNPRSAGKEGGEYSLLDRNNQVTPRAVRVGQIGQAMQRYRDELWKAHKEPTVGVMVDWDNEGIWAAMSINGRDDFRDRPIDARIGISRALINANVPFEYVTADDVRNGLAARYPVIYLPAFIAINQGLFQKLSEYVEQGGRLVMDMPGGWFDERSALIPTGKGSAFEQLFGASLDDYQYSDPNRLFTIEGQTLEMSSIGYLTPTSATVKARFGNGKPAVTENKKGKGSAVIVGYEAGLLCKKPGNDLLEKLSIGYSLGSKTLPYRCSGAIAYRLAAPQADHYFLINDGPATQAVLEFDGVRYAKAVDAVTGETLPLNQPIDVEAYGGRWVRFEK